MTLKKCDNEHFYDAERFDICPHYYNSTKTGNNDMVGGIVLCKCMWCSAENALKSTANIVEETDTNIANQFRG